MNVKKVPMGKKKGPYEREKRSLYTLFFIPKGLWGLINATEREVIFHAAILTIKKAQKKIIYHFKMFTLTCKNFGIKIFFVLRNENVLKKC